MDQEKIKELQDIIDQSQHFVFFGGAGVSTESGIPDFRSANGLYMQDSGYEVPAEEIISHSFFEEHPKEFFSYYFEHLVFPDAQPNVTHRYLADLEKSGKDVAIVTQNIDGLHQKAGSKRVYELHGSTLRNYCLQCNRHYTLDQLQKDKDGIPRCVDDQAIVRPDVVLYEESLDQETVVHAVQAIQEADTLMVAGTSLNVYPAAGFINYFNGDHLVVINKTEIPIQRKDALVFQESLGDVFSQLHV